MNESMDKTIAIKFSGVTAYIIDILGLGSDRTPNYPYQIVDNISSLDGFLGHYRSKRRINIDIKLYFGCSGIHDRRFSDDMPEDYFNATKVKGLLIIKSSELQASSKVHLNRYSVSDELIRIMEEVFMEDTGYIDYKVLRHTEIMSRSVMARYINEIERETHYGVFPEEEISRPIGYDF